MPWLRQACWLLLAALWLPAWAQSRSDILLHIVQQCVSPATTSDCSACRSPRADSACGAGKSCRQTTEVWALTEQFTAIRDIKMCGCPASFVHGLAMPLATVTGVEDPARPEAIWPFAWQQALARIEPENIALVVNPRLQRSQNQLHVHLVRLRPDAMAAAQRHEAAVVADLTQVWAIAARHAQEKGLVDPGVMVTAHPGGGFRIVVTPFSPEDAFTQYRCE